MSIDPQYLGDGVYVSHRASDGAVVLTTGNHDPEWASNTVYMEPEVLNSLLGYLRRVGLLRNTEAS